MGHFMMARVFSPWTTHIVERAARGPVSYSQLLAEAAALVPPGQGFRTALDGINSSRRRSGSGRVRKYTDPERIKDKRIRVGQRSVAAKAIADMLKRHRIEQFDVDGTIMLRKGPRELGVPEDFTASRVSPITKAFLRAVRDGPVFAEEVIEACYPLVPEDEAVDRARRNRKRISTSRGYSHTARPENREWDFRVGARMVVQPTLASLVRKHRLVMDGTGREAIIAKGPRWHDPDAEG